MIQNKKIIITGTHLTPALAFINQLQKDNKYKWQIFYFGRNYASSDNSLPSIESKIIPQKKIPFYGLNCGKFDRRWLPNTLIGIPQTILSFFISLYLVRKIKPDICLSFGGYVSVPVIISSYLFKIPSITHEQTNTISLSTKINSFFTDFTALSFPKKKYSQKQILTGNLLRPEIYQKKSGFFQSKKISLPIIFVTAGNQGSHLINLYIPQLAKSFPQYYFVHQTGPVEYSTYKKTKLKNYLAIDYINSHDIGWILNHSRLIISRSGANTSQEIVALSKNSILVPLPQSQQDEQLKNAQWVAKKLPKSTIIINQQQLTIEKLSSAIKKIIKHNPPRLTTKPQQNSKLLHLCHEIIS